jgi:hypothetical protein
MRNEKIYDSFFEVVNPVQKILGNIDYFVESLYKYIDLTEDQYTDVYPVLWEEKRVEFEVHTTDPKIWYVVGLDEESIEIYKNENGVEFIERRYEVKDEYLDYLFD